MVPTKAVIRYASYGRGVWETPSKNVRTTNAVVKASNSNICPMPLGTTPMYQQVIVSRDWSFPAEHLIVHCT
ncbi:MAG: hypothetical protein IPN94_23670 [Sphingobacteriales bacterium]|nr:hypothetical protein [Sphingobacteriales bacterium]